MMRDADYIKPAARRKHVIHDHPKRREVFRKARKLGTIHADTEALAEAWDSHAVADDVMRELAEALRLFLPAHYALARYDRLTGDSDD